MEERKMAEIINDAELIEAAGGIGTHAFQYTIRKGDCLSVLAQRYHTTVSAIMAPNSTYSPTRKYYIESPTILYADQLILIPAVTE